MLTSDYEFMLTDRIAKIQAINEQHDLLNNSYISFSGGKDSCVLSHLIDLALPGNKIPRVFANTGIEHNAIRKFVLEQKKNDDRFIILTPKVNIPRMLKNEGYPFKSKQHSHNLAIYWRNKDKTDYNLSLKRYLGIIESSTKFRCPKILEYQFKPNFNLKCSDMCCTRMKKEPMKKWAKEFNKTITLTGMRSAEGGQRASIGCIVTDKDNQLSKFHPLLVISDEFEEEFIKRENIQLCELYYEPYNFNRTGCKGCPFNLNLQKDLETLYKLLPNEYYQCLHLWKPVYDEYIRLGYRLTYYPHEKGIQTNIFDYIEE